MGNGILIIVAAFVVAASIMVLTGKGSAIETREELSNYENVVIARDAAESGFSEGLSMVERDLMGVDDMIDGVMSSAEYDVSIVPTMYGDLEIQSIGQLHDARHQIDANVIFEVPIDAAAMLSSDSVVVSLIGAGSKISGIDMRSPTTSGSLTSPGYLSPTYGIRTNSGFDATVKGQLSSSGSSNKVIGFGGDESVVGGFDASFYQTLYNEAMASAGAPYYQEFFGTSTISLNGSNFGSPQDPQIVVVHGDATLSGSGTGYGLLLVNDGDFTTESDEARWEGIVFARNYDGLSVDMSAGGSVHGGLMALEYNGATSIEECTPDFEITGDETLVNEAFRVRIEVLGAAISMGAGGYDMPVTAQLKIGDQTIEPWGDYGLALDGNVNRDGTFVYEPTEIFPPGAIKVNARSWAKSGGGYVYKCTGWGWYKNCGYVWQSGDGSQNEHWSIHMEKDSESSDQQLEVLADDSPVPDITGFDGQTSAADFVSEYIDDGYMNLEDNQSIYLFELGVNNPGSSAHDYQDMVVIVTMVPASASSCTSGPVAANPYLDLKMANGAQLQYSAEAVAKLGKRLNAIKDRTEVVVSSQRSTSN